VLRKKSNDSTARQAGDNVFIAETLMATTHFSWAFTTYKFVNLQLGSDGTRPPGVKTSADEIGGRSLKRQQG
jgi:hypothetical protein